jgi:hypothetical protein
MSTGIAETGRRAARVDHPVPLPVQALDHAAGYLLAGAAITGLAQRLTDGTGSRWRTSLARVASLLAEAGRDTDPVSEEPLETAWAGGPIERTTWGRARRIPPPLVVEGAPLRWTRPARPLGSDAAAWDG